MIATAVACAAAGLAAASPNLDGEFNIGFFAPMVVDLAAWYTVGAIAGVFPVP